MKVKFTDLYKLTPHKKLIFNKLKKLIKNSNFIGGIELKKFEKNFQKFVGSKYFISVANGTDALEIAIKALNLKKGSEIIVPVNTWISTAEAVLTNGFKVVFCDVNLDDYTICIKDLKKKINSKTKAIIAVHLFGNPSDMHEIKKLIKKKDIKLIEDCAQAHGSKINTRHVGNFSDVATFSFFPGKNLGAFGDAGGIATNSKKVADYCVRARAHGAMIKYDHKFSGRNSRLDTIQSAILNIKLRNYKKVIIKRNKIAQIYFDGFKNIKNIKTFNLKKNNTYSFHQFVIRTNERDKLMKYLEKFKIQTMIHYPYMLNELDFFQNKIKLINGHNLGKKILSLPISEEHELTEIRYVIKKIKSFYNKSNEKN